jgi:hypothetical protein
MSTLKMVMQQLKVFLVKSNSPMQPILKDWNLQGTNNCHHFYLNNQQMKRVFLSTLLALLFTGLFAQKVEKAK